jgi:formate hydrogenlyase subunit 3/multisubunit Na+/H+ antiporter MnhD subunit
VTVGAAPALSVAVPMLLAAALVGLGPVIGRRLADTVAVATAAAVTALCAVLLAQTATGPVVYWFGGWTPRDGVALGVAFAVDPVGAGLATLAGVLATAALVYSWRTFEAVGTLYHALMLVFLAAIVGFCLSGDLFNMFVFYELLSVAAYALAGWRTEDPGSLRGALNFAMTNSVGGFVVLSGIALLYGRTGALNLAQLGQTLAAPCCCCWSGSSSRRRWCRSTSGWPTPTRWRPSRSGCCSPGWSRSSACTRSPAPTGRSSPARCRAGPGCAPCCCWRRWPPPWSAG